MTPEPTSIATLFRTRTVVTLLATWTLGIAAARASNASFIPLGHLTETSDASYALAVSADGSVVVGHSRIENPGNNWGGFRWTEQTGMVPLADAPPLTDVGRVRGVSADGTVIAAEHHRWTASGLTDLGDFTSFGISGDGNVIFGFIRDSEGMKAAYWTEITGIVVVGALGTDPIDAWFSDSTPDGSIMTGQSMIESPNVEAMRWSQHEGLSGLGDVPGGLHYALGWGISDDGSVIVGEAIGDVGDFEAFRWTTGGGNELLDPQGAGLFFSTAQDVTPDGSVVVGYSGRVDGAAVWDASHGFRSIKGLLENEHGLDLTGWVLGTAYAISDDGRTIVGSGTNPDGKTEAWVARFPTSFGPTVPATSQWGVIIMAALVMISGTLMVRRTNSAAPNCAAN